MTQRTDPEDLSKGTAALQAAGYKRGPRVWLTEEQYQMVLYMGRQNFDDIIRIKDRAYGRR